MQLNRNAGAIDIGRFLLNSIMEIDAVDEPVLRLPMFLGLLQGHFSFQFRFRVPPGESLIESAIEFFGKNSEPIQECRTVWCDVDGRANLRGEMRALENL